MPRSSSRQSSASKPIVQDESQSQWVMIAEEKLFEPDSSVQFCRLRHPKSDQAAMYLICGGGTSISEVVNFKPDYGSWLIGNNVQKDGGIVLSTPVDPIFLVLPYLINAGKGGKFMTLDQIVVDDEFPDCNRLLECSTLSSLDQVADVKGGDDFQAYRYSSDKAHTWLKTKVDFVVEALENNNVGVSESGAQSANFVRSKKDKAEDSDAYLRYAHGLVSDYLPLELGSSLKDFLCIKETKENIKPESKEEGEPPNKKSRLSEVTPTEDYSANGGLKKEDSKGKQTLAQKKLGKIDKSGMKSMMSFFKKS